MKLTCTAARCTIPYRTGVSCAMHLLCFHDRFTERSGRLHSFTDQLPQAEIPMRCDVCARRQEIPARKHTLCIRTGGWKQQRNGTRGYIATSGSAFFREAVVFHVEQVQMSCGTTLSYTVMWMIRFFLQGFLQHCTSIKLEQYAIIAKYLFA